MEMVMPQQEDEFLPKVWRQAVERQIDSLQHQLETLEGQIGTLKEHLESRVSDVFMKLSQCTADLERRIEETALKTDRVDANTSEVVKILRDWKGAMSVLKFVSKVVVPFGAICTAAAAVLGLLKLLGVL